MADSKSPKYKSIDDILDALKDRSADASDDEVDGEDEPVTKIDQDETDSQSSLTSGGVKTAKQLRDELSEGHDELDPLDEETEAAAPEAKEDPAEEADSDEPAAEDSDEKPALTMPHVSGPFKAHINPEDSESIADGETPPQRSSVFAPVDGSESEAVEESPNSEVKFNLGPTPTSGHSSAEPEADPDGEDAPTPAFERNLDDLATESQPTADQHIPRITPRTPINSEMGQHFAPPPPTSVNTHSFDYDLNKSNTGRGSKFHILILAIIGLIVIAGSVYFLKYQFKVGSPTPTPNPSPTDQPTPTPTPTPTPIARGDFKIKVLNGTSQSGLAASVAAQLKSLGFQIAGTGNATNSAFTQTVARTKADNTTLFDQLVRDLAGTYTITAGPALKSSDPQDAELILGTH